MDALTHAALIGTARATTDALTTATPIDELVPTEGIDRERALLLRAGALDIYREAGMLPLRRADPLPDPAPAESQPQCSPGAAAVVQILLKQNEELLSDALDRMIAFNLRLPPELLPNVLGGRLPVNLRPQLRRVIGERGQWLARFNSAWAWATEAPLAGDAVPPDAETIWQEGQPSQRLEVFTRVRAANPDLAREWLTDTWKREKADMRADLLSALATHLTPEDEPYLEAGLDDKVERVRLAAAAVLAQLPSSAFVARMTARADAMLAGFTPGALHVSEHIRWAADFARDGLNNDPPRGTAKSDWLLQQVLGNVPLAHWEQRFSATAEALTIAALGNPYESALMVGWSKAAISYGGADWLTPLWAWWAHPHRARLAHHDLRNGLLARMPQAESEAHMLHLIEDNHENWPKLLASLPRPWSAAFATAYTERLLRYMAMLEQDPTSVPFDGLWPASFRTAVLGMPVALLATLPDEILNNPAQGITWQMERWQRDWRELREIASLRQRIINEIRPAQA